MSVNVPTWYVQQYNQNIQQLLQQKMSRLRAAVRSGSHVGQSASPVDQVGAVEMQEVTSRFAPMPRVDAATDRRWVRPIDCDLPQLIDSFDKLRILTDPNGIYVQNAVAAANRKFDDIIGNAFFASASTGVTGGTSTAFTTATQTVGVNTGGTASGMNVAKLRAAKKILLQNEALEDGEPIYCAITADEHDELLNEIQVISTDYNDKPVLVEGEVKRFLGVNFIRLERPWLTTTGTDDQAGQSKGIPMWVPSGVYLGVWNEIETNVSKRNDIQGEPWQAYTKMSAGATRVEEKKVVRIWCR